MDVVRLGILGGTFDPIHNGHLQIARYALRRLSLERVLFVPAGDPPHKQGQPVTSATHRLKMVELAVTGETCFAVSRIDIDRPGPHYTVDMIAEVQATYNIPPKACSLIMGSDSLISLPVWHNPQKLLKSCRLAVIHRPGYPPDLSALTTRFPALPARIDWIEMPSNPISATDLRQKFSRSEDVEGQIPPPVMAYIRQNGLYAPSP